ncbi:MAG: hypothetical protein JSW22_05060 [Chloroflexota bacterium]|nr:MAG: hypothetical protein JSW22_05060 [Chloroflexota bacterium]
MRVICLICLASALLISLISMGCICPITPFSQPAWSNTFGGSSDDYALSVQQTSDGGYIMAGSTESYGAGGADVWLIKTDSSGNEMWNKTFGGASDDSGYSVGQTSDGGYIIAGSTYSYGVGDSDMWLIKTDSSGNVAWNKTFGTPYEDHGNSVQQTSDGGYIVAGWTYSAGAGDSDVWLIKINPLGDETWSKTLGGWHPNWARSIRFTPGGGYIIVGSTEPYVVGDANMLLIKAYASGNEKWHKHFGGSGDDYGYSVQQTSDGGYIIAGDTFSYGHGNRDAWLIKTDSSGNEMWSKTFGCSGSDHAESVQQTGDGGYVICGSSGSPYDANRSSYNVRLIKTDSLGNETWSKKFGGSDSDWGVSVQQTSDGGYVIAGYTRSYGAGSYDAWLMKVSA